MIGQPKVRSFLLCNRKRCSTHGVENTNWYCSRVPPVLSRSGNTPDLSGGGVPYPVWGRGNHQTEQEYIICEILSR